MSSSASLSEDIVSESAENGNSYQSNDADTAVNPFELEDEKGDRGMASVIQDYCRRAHLQGNHRCIWLCVEDGRRVFATDVPLESMKTPL